MTSIEDMFQQMLHLEQRDENPSSNEILLDWSDSQKLRTMGNLGAGVPAIQARHEFNRALAAGAFSSTASLREVVIDEGSAGTVTYQAKSALPLPLGKGDRATGKVDSALHFIKTIIPEKGRALPESIFKQMYADGFRFQAGLTSYKERSFYGTSAFAQANDVFQYVTGKTPDNPSFSDYREYLVKNQRTPSLYGVHFELDIEGYDVWDGHKGSDPYDWFLSDVHTGCRVDENGVIQTSVDCTSGAIYQSLAKASLDDLESAAISGCPGVEQKKKALATLRATTAYKKAKENIDLFVCKRTDPHAHSPHSKEVHVINCYAVYTAWAPKSVDPPEGWVQANEDTSNTIGDRVKPVPTGGKHRARKPHKDLSEHATEDKTQDFPFAYQKRETVAVYTLFRPARRMPTSSLEVEPVGVLDLQVLLDDAINKTESRLGYLRAAVEGRSKEGTTLGLKVLRLSSLQLEELEAKELEAATKRLQDYKSAYAALRKVLGAFEAGNDTVLKCPITSAARPSLKVRVLLPSDGSLDRPFAEHLKEAHKQKVVIRTVTRLAPKEAVVDGKVQPLPKDIEDSLLSNKPLKGSKGPFPAASHVAWKDLINGYNSSEKYHGLPHVRIHPKLVPFKPTDKAGKTPAHSSSSEIKVLRAELLKKEEQTGALLKTLSEAMVALATKVAEGQTKGGTVDVEDIRSVLDKADTDAVAAFEGDDGRSVSSAGTEKPLRAASPSSHSASSASHMTLSGRRWSRFNPSWISDGGAVLVVRSVHDGNLYMSPRRVEIPSTEEMAAGGDTPLKIASTKEKGKAKAEPGTPPSGSKSQKTAPPAKTGKTEEHKDSKGNLTCFKCPSCAVTYGNSHKDDCPESSTSWGKMTKEAKKERAEALLSKPAGGAPAKSDPKSEGKPKDKGKKAAARIDEVDPLKATTKDLTEAEEKKLRTHFGLQPPPSEDELKDLDAQERKSRLSASAIPRWSIAAVKSDRKNLPAILDGSLTVDHFKAGQYLRGEKKSITHQDVVAKWTALKNKFSSVPLLEKPRSDKEKAFRKEYDLLKKQVGDHAAIPKPKKGSGSPAGRQSPRPQGTTASANSSVLETLKVFAEIMKALK